MATDVTRPFQESSCTLSNSHSCVLSCLRSIGRDRPHFAYAFNNECGNASAAMINAQSLAKRSANKDPRY
eukprot:2311204-Amphidinium_carterae.1